MVEYTKVNVKLSNTQLKKLKDAVKNTTGNLLDYANYKKHYKPIVIDLSKQTKLKDPQQVNFIGKLLTNTGATMFFIIEKSGGTSFNFLQNSVTIV